MHKSNTVFALTELKTFVGKKNVIIGKRTEESWKLGIVRERVVWASISWKVKSIRGESSCYSMWMKALLRDFIQMLFFFNILLALFMPLLSLALFGEWQIASKFSVDFPFTICFSFIWFWLKDHTAFRPTSDLWQKNLALSPLICVKHCSGENFHMIWIEELKLSRK